MTSTAPGDRLAPLEERLGYQFRQRSRLSQAVTHASAVHDGQASNERLEFLGDRVLGLILAELLIDRFPDAPEGQLAKRHAPLVSRESLARVGETIALWPYLVFAKGEKLVPGTPSVLADAVEAVIAALYLDGGLDAARAFVLAQWEPLLTEAGAVPRDPKTSLQEWALARGLPLPGYRLLHLDGPAHKPCFEIAVEIVGRSERGVGNGGSKREAEKRAAGHLLSLLEGAGDKA